MAGRAVLSEEKNYIFKIMMVFFIKRNVLSHSPSPCQVMRFGKMCFGFWALIFCLIFREVFMGNYISQMHLIKREISMFMQEDYGKGDTNLFFFYKTWLKMLMQRINSPCSGQQRKYCSLLFFLMEQKNCFFLPTSILYGHHRPWQILDNKVSRRMDNRRQSLLTIVCELF